jgi:hypothetical protein
MVRVSISCKEKQCFGEIALRLIKNKQTRAVQNIFHSTGNQRYIKSNLKVKEPNLTGAIAIKRGIPLTK